MTMHKQLTTLLGLISMSVLLTSCITPGKHLIPENEGYSMAQVYAHETGLGEQGNANAAMPDVANVRRNLVSVQTANQVRRIHSDSRPVRRQDFSMLPNPEINLYLFPHMETTGGEQVPIPGYTTGFFLYTQNHFALPSEEY